MFAAFKFDVNKFQTKLLATKSVGMNLENGKVYEVDMVLLMN